jgi:pyruvate/2-oxoacid:ferredoxin oxidoreductase alpha subunit
MPSNPRNYEMDYYKIVDADYVFVGLKADLASVGREVVDTLRREGLRAGLVMLKGGTAVREQIANLLAQVLAVAVIESERSRGQIAPAVVEALRTAAKTADWYAPGRMPRVYAAVMDPGNVTLRKDHLVGLAKAMRVYEPDRLLVAGDGVAQPAGKALRVMRIAAAVA